MFSEDVFSRLRLFLENSLGFSTLQQAAQVANQQEPKLGQKTVEKEVVGEVNP